MFDKALLWGADQVCTMADVTGVAKSLNLMTDGVCIYSGSYWVGSIFWAVIATLIILVVSTLKRKW